VSFENIMKTGDLTAIMTLKGEAIALGKSLVSSEEALNIEHGVICQPIRVLMDRGTYPKAWKRGSLNV
jgi:H/ACA ribonucleoprotein complex subunit 4